MLRATLLSALVALLSTDPPSETPPPAQAIDEEVEGEEAIDLEGEPGEASEEEERTSCRFVLDPAHPDVALGASVVRVRTTTYGARCSDTSEVFEVRSDGTPLFRLEGGFVYAQCDEGGIVLERDGASVRIVPWRSTLILDPATAVRLERAWQEEAGGNWAELAVFLGRFAAAGEEARAWTLAARASLREGDLAKADRHLARARSLGRPDATWEERRARLARQITEVQRRTMPVRFGKPRRLGKLVFLPRTPSDRPEGIGAGPSAGLFWQGQKLCVEQEPAEPRAMRCFDVQTGRWGATEPLRIEGGIPGRLERGDCAETTCYEQSFLWHSALPQLNERECPPLFLESESDFVDLVPGPLFVLQAAKGLEVADREGKRRPLPDGIPSGWLRATNGSTLAGGHLYFFGAALRDGARPVRTWLPFRGTLSNVEQVLVSPDRTHVAVLTSSPNELWLVPMATANAKPVPPGP